MGSSEGVDGQCSVNEKSVSCREWCKEKKRVADLARVG